MNGRKWIAIACLLTVMAFGAAWAQHHAQGQEVTLKGEVIDLQCYMLHPDDSTGPDHAKCAQACMKKGLPMGFLTEDGKLYLLLGPGHDGVQHLSEKAGQTISLQGTVIEQNGMPAFQVKQDSSSHSHH